MTTAFTAYIEDGGTDSNEFILRCSRAFMPLISMRDEGLDVPIPDVIEPSPYHRIELEKAQKKLDEAKVLTIEQAAELAEQDFKEKMANHIEYLRKKEELKQKFLIMLHKVMTWQPPTPDHINLKMYMIDQINGGIENDCAPYGDKPVKLTPEVWLKLYIEDCQWQVNYHVEEWEKEQERSAYRTEWIRELKKSLK